MLFSSLVEASLLGRFVQNILLPVLVLSFTFEHSRSDLAASNLFIAFFVFFQRVLSRVSVGKANEGLVFCGDVFDVLD
jgi:hypothetical protein